MANQRKSLTIAVIALLFMIVATIIYTRQKDSRFDFEKWLTNPDDRARITEQMLDRQNKEQIEREAAAKRHALILSLTESELIEKLPDLTTGEEKSAALERLVMLGKDEHWELFRGLYASKELHSAARSVCKALTERKRESGISAPFFTRLYDFAANELATNRWPEGELVEVMILIDQTNAVKEFHDPKWHDFKSHAFSEILQKLNAGDLLLDKATVTTLLSRIPEHESSLSFGSPVSELIVLAQRAGVAEFEDLAYKLMSHPKIDEYQASRMADAICAKQGFPDIDNYMSEKYKKELKREFPFDKGDDLYKAWVSIGSLDAQVKNGGFAQFFGNGYGYQFTAAIKASERIGDKTINSILVSVRNEFDKHPPPGDYSSDKLGEIYDKIKNKLDEADGNYYRTSTLLDARLKLYLVSQMKSIDLLSKLQAGKTATSETR